MKKPFAVTMRASMLAQLIAVAMCPPPAAAAMESTPDSLDTFLTAAAQLEAAGGESAAHAPAAHRSGGSALTIGVGATLLPIGLGLILDAAQPDGSSGGGVALGTTIGLLVGPAVGLTSGGRGDLAKRGLIIRGVCCGLVVLGGVAAISMLDESSDASSGATGILALGLVGGGVGVASSIYDLVITPKAVDQGRRVSFRPLVTPSGLVGVRATF